MRESTHIADLTMVVPSLEEQARTDALLDQEWGEAVWLPQYTLWARTGMITEEEWQSYQAAYTSALRDAHLRTAAAPM